MDLNFFGADKTRAEPDMLQYLLQPVQDMVNACIQCGTCSGSCPNAFAMDHTPRKMWRMVLTGRADDIFHSKTFIMCSSCYFCTLRCPRGLPLTEAMAALKCIAAKRGLAKYRQSTAFYDKFIQNIRRNGRLREMEFMTSYFATMKSPVIPFRFTALAAKLAVKRKIAIHLPKLGQGRLHTIFSKTEELESRK